MMQPQKVDNFLEIFSWIQSSSAHGAEIPWLLPPTAASHDAPKAVSMAQRTIQDGAGFGMWQEWPIHYSNLSTPS